MNKILLVEDSRMFGSVLKNRIENTLNREVVWVESFKDCQAVLEQAEFEFFAAVLDLNLPDAPDGEVVELVASKDISSIAFTGSLDDGLRETMWGHKIVDYVFKEGSYQVEYVVEVLQRLEKNPTIGVLLVDDSRFFRVMSKELLKIHRFKVYEAESGREALDILRSNPDIRLMLTDYEMPSMDGFELVRQARQDYNSDRLAIVGLSSRDNRTTVGFLKNGANDYILKPFLTEEFYSRINRVLQTQEHLQTIKRISNEDFLTGLHNRRYFFESGQKTLEILANSGVATAVSIVDIDYFKKVNDTYGHDAGDIVLKAVAQKLKAFMKGKGMLARLGGEEFGLIFNADKGTDYRSSLDQLRQNVEEADIEVSESTIRVTISLGVSDTDPEEGLEKMLTQADNRLYIAKSEGRNRVVSEG